MSTIKANNHYDTIVIGAGMAGLGAGIELEKRGINHIILEKNNSIGGLCSSMNTAGQTFDLAPKILILDDSDNSKEILAFLGNNYEEFPVDESVYISKYGFLSFPLQRNLIDLPPTTRKEILKDIIESSNNTNQITSFKDWLANAYGTKFCEMVLFPYEEKKWQHPLDEMDYEWALSRPIKVNIEEVIAGAKQKLPPNRRYFYPKKGSIATLTETMAKQAGLIATGIRIDMIDIANKRVLTNAGDLTYDNLISTMPLDRFIDISDTPNKIKVEAKNKLKRLEIAVFNLVYDGEYNLKGTAVYFPEKKFIFRRVSILKNLCPALHQKGKTTIQVEVSVDPESFFDFKAVELQVLTGLKKVYPQLTTIPKIASFIIPFAYPLQVNGLKEFVQLIHSIHQKDKIYHAGRGGSYDYCNSDLAYKQGKEAVFKAYD